MVRWDRLPDLLFELIFKLLSPHDLTTCRRVCKTWEKFCIPFLIEKTQLRLNFAGSKHKRRLPKWLSRAFCLNKTANKKFVYVTQQNPYWMSGWSHLKIQNAKNSDLKIILTAMNPEILKPAFLDVTHLELSNCSLSSDQFIKLLDMFENLQSLTDSKTHLKSQASLCDDEFLFSKLRTKLTKMRVVRKDIGIETLIYFKHILQSGLNLEELELLINGDKSLSSVTPQATATLFSIILGLLLISQASTLKRLQISFQLLDSSSLLLAEDIYRSLRIMSLSATDFKLTSVNLKFLLFQLENSHFHQSLVPFIKRLQHLKLLNLGMIFMEPDTPRLLELVKPDNFCELNTQINFEVVMSDLFGLESATQTRFAIQGDPILRTKFATINVRVCSSEIQQLSQILPLAMDVKFLKTRQLVVVCSTEILSPNILSLFNNFNIAEICYSFENITNLTILDGESVNDRYFAKKPKNYYDKMTLARIDDTEMQLILKSMTKLQCLRLTLRMDQVSDQGMTGLSSVAYQKMIMVDDTQNHRLEDRDFIGFSFSNLKELKEIILKGLHQRISDITAFHAFNNLPKLKILALCGETRITTLGKSFLYNKFHKSRGCVVFIV